MNRFLLLSLFCLSFGCFSQKSDTIRIEKDPLVITHKVYVLDAGVSKKRQALTVMVIPQWISPESKQENLRFSRGKGLNLRILYEKELNSLKFGIGLGAGMVTHPYSQELSSTYFSEISVTVKDTIERYYKLSGNDTLWYYVTDSREEQRTLEQIRKSTNSQHFRYYFLELPLTLGVFHKLGHCELGFGAEACLRKNIGNTLPLRSLNLTGGLYGTLGYHFSEKFALYLSPRYSRDLTPVSDQFQNSYLQLALSSSFFW